jgi:hypothetical protein
LPYGDGSRSSKVAGAQYTYTFAVTVPGQYKVYAWWTLLNTRTTAAPYTITHARGSDTVIVDQRNPAFGDRWNLLGTYALDGTARVTITAVGGNLTTSADAIALLPARDAVLDNGRNGTAFTGGWSISGGANSYGENSVYSRSPGKTYSYNLSPPWTGVADVYAWWTSLPSRPIDAPYTIAYATGAHVVRVNQTAAGGRWNYLGTYAFNGTARVTVTATSNTVSTGADAVRLAPRPGDLILDEDSPGISRTGAWAVSGGASHYGVLARYSKDRVSTYTYPFALAAPGDYEVFAWWTTISSRSSSVPYHITHASGTTTVLRDQLVDGGRWNSLGTYTFGATARVTIETRADGKSYCADAIRIRKVAP